MLKLQILVVILSTASLTSISGQVLNCNVDDITPSFGEQKDIRVVDGYPRALRTDPIFLGSNQSLTVLNVNANSFEDEYVGVCYSTSDLSCYKSNSDEEDCDNYIRGVAALEACNPSCRVLVCGSNALLSRCTVCNFTGSVLSCNFIENSPPQDLPYTGESYGTCSAENINGQGVFQFQKNHNATFLYVPETEIIYYGLVKENSNPNSIIGLASVSNLSREITNEVTTRTDSQKMVATEAHFVGRPFIDGDFVYFLFREPAQEFASLTEGQSNEINAYYSRIARICKNDVGTDVSSARILTSFLKQRLVCCHKEDNVCSVEYNEIQDFVFSDDDNMIHAIFTNEQNAAPMSALCVFDLAAINETFNTGSFFGADGGTTNDLWREYTGATITPRPGFNCSDPNTGNTNFERDYNLMNDVQTSDVSVFMKGDRFSSLEMPEEDIYIIASEWGCLYQVSVNDTSTDLGDPCQDPIVSSPIKDLELAPNNSYLVISSDDVYILDQCTESDETGGEAGARILSPPAGRYDVRPNSFFEFVADIEITGQPYIYITSNGMQIEDYLVRKNESLDTTDTLLLTRILILNETVTVDFPNIANLNYTLKPYNNYTIDELEQRCAEWEKANKTYVYLNDTVGCGSATPDKPGNFSSEILLQYNQVQVCANCAYNDCADTCPP